MRKPALLKRSLKACTSSTLDPMPRPVKFGHPIVPRTKCKLHCGCTSGKAEFGY
ncbi:hypothetical protein Plhal304r1_c014g0054291 [Plasmopara halstedii]